MRKSKILKILFPRNMYAWLCQRLRRQANISPGERVFWFLRGTFTAVGFILAVHSLYIFYKAGKLELPEHMLNCDTLGDYSQICVLRNACVDSQGLLLNNPLPRYEESSITTLSNFPNPSPDEKLGHMIPARAWVNVRADSLKQVKHKHNYLQGALFIAGFDDQSGLNPFHFAECVLTFFSYSQRNKAERIRRVILFREKPPVNTWLAGFQDQVFRNATVHYAQEVNKTICAERVVFGGTIINLFEGPYHAELFRNSVYKSLGITRRPLGRLVQVTFLRRKDRVLVNTEQIERLLLEIKDLTLKVVTMDSLSFEEQVRIMAETDLLISPHGAGLTNSIFMQQERAVLELFPSKLWYYELYGRIARNAGLFHTHAFGGELHDSAGTIRNCFSNNCHLELKRDFSIMPSDFLPALSHALSWLGHDGGRG